MLSPSELFDPKTAHHVSTLFGRMEIAEAELEEGPEGTSFMALMPPPLLRNLSDHVYRMHARELIQRQGEKMHEATDAEMCAVLSAASIANPLNHAAAWVYWRFFDRVFPGRMEEPYADDYDKGELGQTIEHDARARAVQSR